jgi:hypothetical protein
MYLPSINSKHQRRHLGFGVLIDIWSMYELIGTNDETVYNTDEYVNYMEQTKRIVKMKKGLTTMYVK